MTASNASNDTVAADWAALEGRWPNRAASRFVRADGLAWHVQVMGQGPVALLVHGTGGATHSWATLLPLLAARFTVVAPDLPGHGFTGIPDASGLSLGGMARGLAALLAELALVPALAVGHSAGAAVLLRMALDGTLAPSVPIVGVNAALEPPPALYSSLVGPLVGRVFTAPVVAAIAARAASVPGVVRSLLRSTGTALPDEQVALYEALCRSAPRTGAVMAMMAGWELDTLRDALPNVGNPVTLIAADDDAWVPASVARDAARRIPLGRVVSITGGHLVHEVRAALVAEMIGAAADRAGV